MKVYLDDERQTPEGWVRAYWPQEVIDLLLTGQVTHLSLDHDLGEVGDRARTGYDVVLWIERAVVLEAFVPPEIFVHSANTSAALKMQAGIESIRRLHLKNPRRP